MGTRQYIGARYVPKFADPIAWDNAREYEPLTIVTYMGTSYTSKKPVPTGVEITNSEYWVATGNYNAQVEAYREETQEVAQDVAVLKQKKVVRRGRAKAFWNSSTALSIGVYETNMTGFRYMGRDYDTDENVYIPPANRTLNGHAYVLTSDTAVTAFNSECWQAVFGIVDAVNEGYYKPVVVPILQVLSVDDDTITVGKTKENTNGASLTGEINENIIGRDVLVITRNNNIAGDVTKVTAYTGTTIEIENNTNITAGDYLVIAPADSGKYAYFVSHYWDTASWRNREDDGVRAYSRGVANNEHTYGDIKGESGADYVLKNCISPLASGVYVVANIAISSSSTGTISLSVGADYSHRKSWFILHKQSSDGSYSEVFPEAWVAFDYLRKINVSAVSSAFSTVYSYSFYPWGWSEP